MVACPGGFSSCLIEVQVGEDQTNEIRTFSPACPRVRGACVWVRNNVSYCGTGSVNSLRFAVPVSLLHSLLEEREKATIQYFRPW